MTADKTFAFEATQDELLALMKSAARTELQNPGAFEALVADATRLGHQLLEVGAARQQHGRVAQVGAHTVSLRCRARTKTRRTIARTVNGS